MPPSLSPPEHIVDLQTIVPQTFVLNPANFDRTADLVLFVTDVQDPAIRILLNTIEVMVDGVTERFDNNLQDLAFIDGAQWDTIRLPTVIPTGATTLTVDVLSVDDGFHRSASFMWLSAGLSVPEDDEIQSCCESGRPEVLTMQCTGDDCTDTSHSQDPEKVKCEGNPNDADPVFIIANDKKDPNDSKAKV